jgi:anti-sigma B factor antagonist
MSLAGAACRGPGIIPLMSPPEPHVESLADCVVITLSGELDAFDAPDLRRTFEEALEAKPRVVVLDLAAVTFLDSTVLGAIVGLLRRVREARSELRAVLPDTTARRIFEITNLVAALDVWPSRAEATDSR